MADALRAPEGTSELAVLCVKLGIIAEAKYSGSALPEGWAPGGTAWTVTLRLGRRRLTVPFFTGGAIKCPTAADVLACLTSDARVAEQTFEEFCGDFGYDTDSRKAEATYKACCRIAPRVRRFLDEHFDAVANAEH
jgi:hypothetical protein